MTMDPIAFSALLCSRLCHDLVSPVGAFANGLEILVEETDEEMRRQVMELLAQSARQTTSRLQFFRLAFGSAGGFGETMAANAVRDVTDAYFAGSRVAVDWQPNVQEFSKAGVKTLLNLILVAGEALLRGGRITVEGGRSGGNLELRVIAAGERMALSPDMEATLLGYKSAGPGAGSGYRNASSGAGAETADLDPKIAPAYLALTTAADVGGAIEVRRAADDTLVLALRLP